MDLTRNHKTQSFVSQLAPYNSSLQLAVIEAAEGQGREQLQGQGAVSVHTHGNTVSNRAGNTNLREV